MINKLSDNARLLLACALSALLFLVWDKFMVEPNRAEQQVDAEKIKMSQEATSIKKEEAYKLLPRDEIIRESEKNQQRLYFENSLIKGSINLRGARIDDIILKNYYTEAGGDKNVVLFSPSHSKESYFAEFGWVKSGNEQIELPDNQSIWIAKEKSLAANNKVELYWVNKQGIKFELEINVDDQYMFKINQRIINNSGDDLVLSPYGSLARLNDNMSSDNMVVHNGGIGVFNGKLREFSFDELAKDGDQAITEQTSWMGFSDKYWLSALIPAHNNVSNVRFKHTILDSHHHFQTSFVGEHVSIKAGATHDVATKLFAGAKKLDILDSYENQYKIQFFDKAIDFGILYFITRPLLIVLHYFYGFLGNFGLAILLLTVLTKLLLFPLAHKGFKGMNRLKDLQPKMTALKERYGDNHAAFQKELMELYRKEKVNPMAGCLPIILQIPVFFALYKVLYVSLEMRHAPFFWWIKDLSAADPTTIFNLFGLLPFDPPSFLMVGVLPLLMAISMYVQQKLNPEPTDPNQAMVMKLMPWVLLFMFASFPSGLVLYWAWSNVLSIAQQLLIKKLEA